MAGDRPSPYDLWPALQEQDVAVVFTGQNYQAVQITYVEPLPLSTPLKQDIGAVAAASTLAAVEITGVALQDNTLLQMRFKPLDDVELVLYEPRSQARFTTERATVARVGLATGCHDPEYKSSTFWIQSKDKSPFIEARNLGPRALVECMVVLWGWRYIWRDLKDEMSVDQSRRWLTWKGQPGGQNTAIKYSPWNDRPVTWLAAEGGRMGGG